MIDHALAANPTVAGEVAFRGDWLAKQRTAAPWLTSRQSEEQRDLPTVQAVTLL
jgi:hypothetical protein